MLAIRDILYLEDSDYFFGTLPFEDKKSLDRFFGKQEDPDEMIHNAAFHQSLYC